VRVHVRYVGWKVVSSSFRRKENKLVGDHWPFLCVETVRTNVSVHLNMYIYKFLYLFIFVDSSMFSWVASRSYGKGKKAR
jgi:hypothetical protein